MAEQKPYAITITKGITFTLSFYMLKADRTPEDLTGATAAMMVRENIDDPLPVVSLTSTSGISFDTNTGKVTATIDDSVTSGLSLSRGVYDILINLQGGVTKKPLYGPVIIQKTVTR